MRYGPHLGLGPEGEAYKLAFKHFSSAGYLSKTQKRSFVMPLDSQSATFNELMELDGDDIVYHGSPKESSLQILREGRIDVAKSRLEGERLIHFTLLPGVAEYYARGSGAIFPVYVRDLPEGLVPKSSYGDDVYSGDMGSGVVRSSTPLNIDDRIIEACDASVAERLNKFLDRIV